jgi:hypothetical protein
LAKAAAVVRIEALRCAVSRFKEGLVKERLLEADLLKEALGKAP